ncbi:MULTISPECIES: M48 family metallopeptidase [unclassified Oceanispirochaeta]|nr:MULTISPECIES: M48 family metallopeptidase [unclassified Oceanispirochaeta]NPD75434.1 M48 family metallopeptidase [Oceanispirochaeta sp. M1]
MNFKVYWKENFYFIFCLVITSGFYFGIFKLMPKMLEDTSFLTTGIVFIVYIVFIFLFFLISHITLIGHLQGNAIQITTKQFPEVYYLLESQCETLGIKRLPTLYLIQSGGILNAFATRLAGKNYVVLYSDIFEKAYSDGMDVVEFILAHELTHLKRNHILKRLLVFPANIILLLSFAYSRACEVTCDSFASEISPSGSTRGLVLLSAGTSLYSKVNIEEYLSNANKRKTFAKWLSEILSTHPHISKRIDKLMEQQK